MAVPEARKTTPWQAREVFRAIGGLGVPPGRHRVPPGQHCSAPGGRTAEGLAAFGPVAVALRNGWLAEGFSSLASGYPGAAARRDRAVASIASTMPW